ncbi:MAG: hypothetical protein ACK4JE_05105, partial [Endomicrobiia bacterium]
VYIEIANIKNQISEIEDIEIKVDGKKILMNTGASEPQKKYVKLGEFEIEKEGKHQINIKNKNAKQNLKIILVNKEEREKLEKKIWEKINEPQTEVCYIFEKENAQFYVL